jgi:hypothetical protein
MEYRSNGMSGKNQIELFKPNAPVLHYSSIPLLQMVVKCRGLKWLKRVSE